ncbi:MAG: substrate-binding domain-containing protein [Hydrogenophaga sp.]|nr:substrate-binding domain-containing protein [Hydrogenophaga sp.]MDO9202580.1 substrate-binding domain-containing protein [Hydrogenophaga sp.]MDO9484019.1 substrate-binding domain-containing protein [Hydrogenophaga sp.]MDP1894451.1 substrate-binding domain-containing protein [Hydrogenophaga sp.]MDP2095924.1 substrate-binding domain-containing protein [Hydrogenophaga sp.]MDP3342869.1 substrate-binding domain-containing protein [Hydrogenophaga sp.]
MLTLALSSATTLAQGNAVIGLITKTDSNPFFVKMKEGARAEARKLDVRLLTAAGTQDGDTASQIAAIERMTKGGVKTLLIASNGDAILPAVKWAQGQGVQVIALDSPFTGADALFATDNYRAGILIGQYTRAAMGNKPLRIVTLDLFPGHPVGAQRHNGFLKGLGLPAPDATSTELGRDPAIRCMADSFGDAEKGKVAMQRCLQTAPDVNVLYTINEPAAQGAYQALQRAGKEKDVLIVSVDGGCAGVAEVAAGRIAATSQQYPLRMAAKGVAAGAEFMKTGRRSTGYFDTGVNLITAQPVTGIDSKDIATGTQLCWGKK